MVNLTQKAKIDENEWVNIRTYQLISTKHGWRSRISEKIGINSCDRKHVNKLTFVNLFSVKKFFPKCWDFP